MHRIVFELDGLTASCVGPRGYTLDRYTIPSHATMRHNQDRRDFLTRAAPHHQIVEQTATRLVVEDPTAEHD